MYKGHTVTPKMNMLPVHESIETKGDNVSVWVNTKLLIGLSNKSKTFTETNTKHWLTIKLLYPTLYTLNKLYWNIFTYTTKIFPLVDYNVFICVFKPGKPLEPNEIYRNRSKREWYIRFPTDLKSNSNKV